MKKTLAILLTLALVICMMPANAFAAEPSTGYTVQVSGSYTYDGTQKIPTISVTDNGTPVDSKNYSVSYQQSSNTVTAPVNAGEYTIVVTENVQAGTTPKTGTATFTIQKLDITGASVQIGMQGNIADTYVEASTVPLDQSGLTFYFNGYTNPTIFNDDNLTVKVTSVDESKKEATLSVTAKENSNLRGTKSGLIVRRVTGLTTDNIDVSVNSYNRPVYNGLAQNVKLTVGYKVNGKVVKTLVQGTDFSVMPLTVVNATDKNFTITGIGNYAGTVNVTDLDYIQPKAVGTYNGANNVNVSTISTQVVGSKPKVTVTDVINGKTTELALGKDYVCEIDTSRVGQNLGNATVIFQGNYSGTRAQTFDVVSADADLSKATVTVDSSNIVRYTGTTQTPRKVTVVVGNAPNQKALNENVDYTVAYQYYENGKTYTTTSPTDAKTYTVLITGKGNYGGQKAAAGFTIPKYDMKYVTVNVSMASAASAPYVTVKSTYENIYFTKDRDYTVTYSFNTYSGQVFVTVRPTAYGNLTGAAKSDYYPIAAKSITSCTASFKDGRTSAAYTGSNIPINLVVKDGYYTTLRQGTDYTVTYKNAAGKVVTAIRDAGTYTIEINGRGMYTGTTYLTFTVTGTDISNYTVTLRESSVKADGFAKIPVITSVAYSYYSKLSVNDYTVSYQDSTGKTVTRMSAPGTYKVIVTGKNGYSGSCYATFRIVGLAQSVTGVKNAYKAYPTTETFKLYPQVTEGTITYTSSDPSVASVDAFGYVTPLRAGRAVITISTTGNVKYDPADKDVVIKVYPNKAKLSQKPWNTGKKGQIKVRWNKQDNVTRYQVIYSRDKSFKKGSYKVRSVNAATNSYTTQSTTVKGLYSGYTYYVKVRAIKYVYNGYGQRQVYYGNWSNWRSVKVK